MLTILFTNHFNFIDCVTFKLFPQDILQPSMSSLYNQITPTLISHHHVKSKFSLYTSNHSITTNDFEDICQLLELTIYDKLHTNHVFINLILSCLTK